MIFLNLYDIIKNKIKNTVYTKLDFKTKRKIVVIESDDWGSIRIPSKKVHDSLIAQGFDLDSRPYERLDTLESEADLNELFNILIKYKDSKGNYPIITTNALVANPDFKKIKDSNFDKYYYEDVIKTYNSYKGSEGVPCLLKEGLKNRLIKLQNHGREHFNTELWLKNLKLGDKDLLTAFEHSMCGIFPKNKPEIGNIYMLSLESSDSLEKISDGLKMFNSIWGYTSKTFVAPCYCWNKEIEKILKDNSVKLIQTSRIQKFPNSKNIKFHYSAEQNKCNQFYSVRNCTFEPATIKDDNNVENIISQIESCFNKQNIAVISSHRINYVGGININNRNNTLLLLDKILKKLLIRNPDIEFMTSDQLIDLFPN